MKTSRAIGAEITHTNEGIQLNLARIRKYLTRSFARNTIVISISLGEYLSLFSSLDTNRSGTIAITQRNKRETKDETVFCNRGIYLDEISKRNIAVITGTEQRLSSPRFFFILLGGKEKKKKMISKQSWLIPSPFGTH